MAKQKQTVTPEQVQASTYAAMGMSEADIAAERERIAAKVLAAQEAAEKRDELLAAADAAGAVEVAPVVEKPKRGRPAMGGALFALPVIPEWQDVTAMQAQYDEFMKSLGDTEHSGMELCGMMAITPSQFFDALKSSSLAGVTGGKVEGTGRYSWKVTAETIRDVNARAKYALLKRQLAAIAEYKADADKRLAREVERAARAADKAANPKAPKATADPAAVAAYVKRVATESLSLDELMALVEAKKAALWADEIVANAIAAQNAEVVA